MTTQSIIDRVKSIMEEITPFDDGMVVLGENSDAKPIVSYINSMLQPSADELLNICPLSLTIPINIPLTSGSPAISIFTSELSGGKMIGYLPIPSNFIRLHTFKMNDWERPVHRPISVEHPDYILQLNKSTRGKNAKPVVVRNSDKFEIYTFDSGDTIQTALYVTSISFPSSGDVTINQNLINPLCYLIASKVFEIFGSENYKLMLQEVQNLLKESA